MQYEKHTLIQFIRSEEHKIFTDLIDEEIENKRRLLNNSISEHRQNCILAEINALTFSRHIVEHTLEKLK